MGMNPTLAAMYNTHGAGAAAAEEQTKIAHLELFAKAAMAQGIDLSQLDQGTREELYSEFTSKLAEEEGMDDEEDEDEEEEEEKDAAARREFAAQAEWQEKNAQADFLGRRMAHSFWDEYNEISKEARSAGEVLDKGIGAVKTYGRRLSGSDVRKAEKAKDTAIGHARRAKDMSSSDKVVQRYGKKATDAAGTAADEAKKSRKARLITGGAVGGAGAVGGGIAALSGGKDKEASAFDFEAAEQALKLASASGWDEHEADQRLAAVLTLGPGESEKIAHAGGDYGDALNIRGLELLETAGYPVDWNQVFG